MINTLLLCILVLALPAQSLAAAAFVQSKSLSLTPGSVGTTIAVTLTSTVGSGNAICGAVTYNGGGVTSATVSDDKSNTYTVQRNAGGSINLVTFYLVNITNAPQTITVTYVGGSPQYRALAVGEASGIATSSALDGETAQEQGGVSGTNSVSSGAVTTTVDGDFICGFSVLTSAFSDGNQFTAGTGYTEREEAGAGGNIGLTLETQVQATAGSIAATFTPVSSINANTAILTLKAAAVTARNRIW